jgi:hypothetical protein
MGARASSYGGDFETDKRYRAELPRKIAESVRLAESRLVPARVTFLAVAARRP